MSEEEEIKILMAREIVEEICSEVDVEKAPRCRAILHKILVNGATEENLKPLKELPWEAKIVIMRKLMEMGVEWKK
jgi:hypothetical protein